MPDKKYAEFVGVDSLYYAIITTDTDSIYLASTPVYLAPVAEIAQVVETNNQTTYYDNVSAFTYNSEGKSTLNITVSNVPASLMATLFGKDFVTNSGLVFDNGENLSPYVALGFRYSIGNGDYRYYWYYKGNFAPATEEASTKTSDIEVKTYSLTYTGVNTAHKFTVNGKQKSLKRVYGDTTDTNFSGTDWFTNVKVPTVA